MAVVYWIHIQKRYRSMKPVYYVLSADGCAKYIANIRPAFHQDFVRTERENWQTSWLSDFIQDPALEKYALEVADTDELVGLGAYRNMPEGVLVYRDRGRLAGIWYPVVHRLWLWRRNLLESKNH